MYEFLYVVFVSLKQLVGNLSFYQVIVITLFIYFFVLTKILMNVEGIIAIVTGMPSVQTQSVPINASARQDIPVMA